MRTAPLPPNRDTQSLTRWSPGSGKRCPPLAATAGGWALGGDWRSALAGGGAGVTALSLGGLAVAGAGALRFGGSMRAAAPFVRSVAAGGGLTGAGFTVSGFARDAFTRSARRAISVVGAP